MGLTVDPDVFVRGDLELPNRPSLKIDDSPGIPFSSAVVGGLVVGASRDPIIGTAFKAIDKLIPGVTEFIRSIERETEGSTVAEVSAKFGEFAPLLVGATGAARLGAKGASFLLSGAGRSGILGREIGKNLAKRAADQAGVGAAAQTVGSGLERGAQFAGTQLGQSSFFGAETLLETGDIGEAAKSAGIALAIGSFAEGALIGGGKLLTGRATPINRQEQLAKFTKKVARTTTDEKGRTTTEFLSPKDIIDRGLTESRAKLKGFSDKIFKLLGGPEQMRQFLRTKTVPEFDLRLKAAGLPTLGAKRIKRLADLKVQRAEALTAKNSLLFTKKSKGVLTFVRDSPYNPEGIQEMLTKMGIKMTSAPESFFGKFGATAAKFFGRVEDAEIQSVLVGEFNRHLVNELETQAMRGLGMSAKNARNRGLRKAAHEWEKVGGGSEAVRIHVMKLGRSREQADKVVDAFEQLDGMTSAIHKRLEGIGGLPALDFNELRVGKFLTHASENLTKRESVRRLKLGGFSDEEASAIVERAEMAGLRKPLGDVPESVRSAVRRGPGNMGFVDFRRVRPGTLDDQFKAGIPVMQNPFDGARHIMTAGERRIQYANAVGPNGETIEQVAKAVGLEGGDGVLFQNLVDSMLDAGHHTKTMARFARNITSVQIAAKLPLAVIPNFTQSINTAMVFGSGNLLRAFFANIGGGGASITKKEVAKSVGIFGDTTVRAMTRAFADDGANLSGAEKLASFVLKYSGFSWTERMNRMLAGYAGHFIARDTIARGIAGRLRGTSLDRSRRIMTDLGLDLDDIVRKVKAQGDRYFQSAEWKGAPGEFAAGLETRAIFRAAQKTQFIPSRLRKPTMWSHPIGRVLTQFKTFAISQGRLLRDSVLAEAAIGNMRPLAHFVAIAPVAGEAIIDVRSLITLRERPDAEDNLVVRAFNDISAIGGFGIAMDMATSARFGGGLEALLGPTASDANRFATAFFNGSVPGVLGQLEKQPIVRAVTGLMGVGAVALTMKAMELYLEEDDKDIGDIPTLEEFRLNERSQ